MEASVPRLSSGRPARVAVQLTVRGQVQGVGFRPFVVRLAREHGLAGRVGNGPEGVHIHVEGPPAAVARFRAELVGRPAGRAVIEAVVAQTALPAGLDYFAVADSSTGFPRGARVPRDLATCADCRREVFDPKNRRGRYPFTNCTACGPRYSILGAMPYDRPATIMRRFVLCAACRTEYETPEDRRFHAEPNACASCGPQAALWDRTGRQIAGRDEAIRAAARFIQRGRIVALKGLGGYQLLVRADDRAAVSRLRSGKHRPSKPLAVMVPSLERAASLGCVGQMERRLLTSPDNPIVLLEKRGATGGSQGLAPEVAPHVGTIGLFLPTTPLHHLLLAEVRRPVVATSGNRAEEPIVTEEREALSRLAGVADLFLVHDRPIVRRVDDSLVRLIGGRPVTLRLARGMAPLPLPALESDATGQAPALAIGGHQKVAVAAWTGAQAVLGEHLGDMDGPEARAGFVRATQDLLDLYGCEPELVAHDLHPEYFTTAWAAAHYRPVGVQHHHAHAVACMAEHGLLDREVIALTWDGTGYGTDGTVWGGEILRARVNGFERVASLLPFPLPGGEAAMRRPNRAAFGLLWVLLGDAVAGNTGLLRRLELSQGEAQVLAGMVRQGVNAPWTSSMGRLFDGVASLLLGAHAVTYEGEAAAWLEAVADRNETGAYSMSQGAGSPLAGDPEVPRGDWRPVIRDVLSDLETGIDPGRIAARFHLGLAAWAAAVVASQPPAPVVLTGGCFQNRFLAERTCEALKSAGADVYSHGVVPPGDGGLAVGQLAVAVLGAGQGRNLSW